MRFEVFGDFLAADVIVLVDVVEVILNKACGRDLVCL
jgi:hypothetical protein